MAGATSVAVFGNFAVVGVVVNELAIAISIAVHDVIIVVAVAAPIKAGSNVE